MTVEKHEGDHNREYFFTLNVTNHAMLSYIKHLDILVDDSPPEKGVVLEGIYTSVAVVSYNSLVLIRKS